MRPSLVSGCRAAILAPALALLCGACSARQRPASPPSTSDSVDVGYGSQARRDVATSIVGVDGDVARRNSPTSVGDMIDGRVAGVEVRRLAAGGVSVRIRGQRSLKSDEEPLFVVDGIPQHAAPGGALFDLDPRDIAKIEVLKDAGATAAYGSRGANGVILISTRKPQ